MKKINLLVLLLMCTPVLFAQSINELIDQFKNEEGVTYQKLDQSVLPDDVMKEVGKDAIEELVVLRLEDCAPELIQKFNRAMKEFKITDEGYSTMIKTSEDDEYTHILSKSVDDMVVEMLVLHGEEDEAVLVWLKGKGIPLNEIDIVTK